MEDELLFPLSALGGFEIQSAIWSNLVPAQETLDLVCGTYKMIAVSQSVAVSVTVQSDPVALLYSLFFFFIVHNINPSFKYSFMHCLEFWSFGERQDNQVLWMKWT